MQSAAHLVFVLAGVCVAAFVLASLLAPLLVTLAGALA
jgi:hypothetical protein